MKPVVFTFAMLLAIVSTWSCWAFMPEAAVISARIMDLPWCGSARLSDAPQDLFDGGHDSGRGFEAALRRDQADHLVDRVDVRALEVALVHDGCRSLLQHVRARAQIAGAIELETRGILEVDEFQTADRRGALADFARPVDRERFADRLDRLARAVPRERFAGGSQQDTGSIEVELAVAREDFAVVRVGREETRAFERDVERVARALDLALAEVRSRRDC